MTRSERLAKDNKVEVVLYTVPIICDVTTDVPDNSNYIATDTECLYDGKECSVDIYEDYNGNYYGMISMV